MEKSALRVYSIFLFIVSCIGIALLTGCPGGGGTPAPTGGTDTQNQPPQVTAPPAGSCEGAADGTPCDDGNPCTHSDACLSGVCTGVAYVCDDHLACTDNVCDGKGGCSYPIQPNFSVIDGYCYADGASDNGCRESKSAVSQTAWTNKADDTPCNDNNACTRTDVCRNGMCVGTNPVVCSAKDQCHDIGICNPTSGICSDPALPNGTGCDDTRACTGPDRCIAGECIPEHANCPCSSNSDCPADQCHQAGTCNIATGMCNTGVNKVDGTVCDDGNPCTRTDTCQAGVCTGSNPVVCSAMDQCHVAGTCNPADGLCTNPTITDGTPCDDHSLCTSGEKCQSGNCVAAPADVVTCTASDQCHNVGTCQPATGTCTNPKKDDGTLCNDERDCTTGDSCQAGVCTPSNSTCACNGDADCHPLDQCHVAGTCNLATGVCTNPTKPDGTSCNDQDACTSGETCQSGACGFPTSTVTCAALNDCHDIGVCDPGTGTCSNPKKPDGASCDDGRSCTDNEKCQAGNCISPTAPPDYHCTCDDDALCQSLASTMNCRLAAQTRCNKPSGQCIFALAPAGTACDDQNPCTVGETCSATGSCQSPPPKICTGLDQCKSCNISNGLCDIPLSGVGCEDGSACTTNDMCQNGVCVPGPETICTTPYHCYTQHCDSGTGNCVDDPPLAEGAPCSGPDPGNNLCKLPPYTCQNHFCQGTIDKLCYGDQCNTQGTCIWNTGACDYTNAHNADTTPCYDMHCHKGNCDGAGSCINLVNFAGAGHACDDNVACTMNDICYALPRTHCQGTTYSCVTLPGTVCNGTGLCCKNISKPDTCKAP